MDEDFESLYSDELELLNDIEPSPGKHFYLPSNRVLSGRDDSTADETPRSSSSKRHFNELTPEPPLENSGASLVACKKKLKLSQEIDPDEDGPDSPRSLVIDEGEEEPEPVCEPRCSKDSKQYQPEETLNEKEGHPKPSFYSYRSWYSTIPMRGSSGRLSFVRLYGEDWAEDGDLLESKLQKGNLLSKPFWDLYLEAEKELEKEQGPTHMASTVIEGNQLPEGVVVECAGSSVPLENEPQSLWVEKYRPRSYLELLSDEGVNRTMLQWLKLWDFAVFNKMQKSKKSKENKPQTNFQGRKFAPEINEELDEHKRPQQKVVLLCGPPGLGKTTLAHVIGKHAGYNVMELNASDDRSPEIFRTTIESATQMKAVLGKDPRPNCLVIDEIDGAPAPSINVLVNLIKGGLKANRKGKKKEMILSRPIICICNDLYVPALRPLRQIALVLHFPQTQKARLSSRLQEITRKERMKADNAALLALCEKADNDIRSCLSTLQFINGRKSKLSMVDVQTYDVGQKDVQKSLVSVLNEVFQIPKKTKNMFRRGMESKADLETMKFESVLNSAYAFGDYDKLIHSLFDNYLGVNFKDPRLELLQEGPEWLCFTDQVFALIHSHQNYILYPYLPYIAPAFNQAYSVIGFTKMTYQNSNIEFRTRQTQLLNLLTALFSEASVKVRSYVTKLNLIMDTLPSLIHIVQPSIRSIHMHLFSEDEKAQLKTVVSIMIAYNLAYQQSRTADGQYQYILEPNIGEIVRFPGVGNQQGLSYAVKQLIARELEMEKMRQGDSGNKLPEVSEQKDKKVKTSKPIKETISRDFFGRVIQPKQLKEESSVEKKSNASISCQVWFQFKEGYSNAVRRTVRIKDLL